MKHPMWLINTILLGFLLLVVGVIIIFRPRKLVIERFMPKKDEIKPLTFPIPKIDLAQIYSNDLFQTYQPPVVPTEPEKIIRGVPQPPRPMPSRPAIKPPPKLLDPLQVSLQGIMITGNEETNIAVLKNTQTNEQKNYKAGDKIDDAQLIRIMKNKIIIIRSNGQQETLFVNQHDAELDQLISGRRGWSEVVEKIGMNAYTIDPNAFVVKVHNLAQFIDLLNLTTVYQQGKSIGCRVGRIQTNSLATALGLQTGDIVTAINNIPTNDTDNRFTIYKKLITLGIGDTINVSVQRGINQQTITYTLKELAIKNGQTDKPMLQEIIYPAKTMEEVQEEKKRVLHERYRFAPTAQDLRQQQKRTMLNSSRRRPRKRNLLTQQLESGS